MSKTSETVSSEARGEGHTVDTAELPQLPSASLENLELADTQRQRTPGADPYNSVPVPTVPAPGHVRRDFDAMGQLKPRTAAERPPIKLTSDLALRVAGMRADLERVLSDMETLRESNVDSANRKAGGLTQKLRESARHLEDAIDSLLPSDEP